MLNKENLVLIGIDANTKLSSYLRHKVRTEINPLCPSG